MDFINIISIVIPVIVVGYLILYSIRKTKEQAEQSTSTRDSHTNSTKEKSGQQIFGSTENYLIEGMLMGMMLGVVFSAIYDVITIPIAVGIGVAIGASIKKKK